jgi:hypothetical protein
MASAAGEHGTRNYILQPGVRVRGNKNRNKSDISSSESRQQLVVTSCPYSSSEGLFFDLGIAITIPSILTLASSSAKNIEA